ncbi:Ubiquitin-conjugating enzyme E2 R2 [Schistosoma japonicum]|uniref:SJCHGC01051 protein n=1 Tax=Schistosoma japonicum TaxID=6182 RepID=Q5DD88_SCHJA|nr:SJCHGC01051 protein [Schistosoma japonicum]KAH8850119.1 Ubiquitin-conjugating enzyme E2 R2 [Schistosoma japonicum]TNN09326.1 Ubiquitin-conjugating enzyme E2 R2 [Schistosoma japonicum]CAX70026.1 ubiquitin coniugating enzyme 3b [Schistosoma japonicum]CAX74350.1 ubiquitin coniugating enzyme 3b [Schistosoma japonicum]
MASRKPNASAVKALQKELKDLNEFPVEGFKVMVSEDENLFVWDVAIFGPPMTLYEGGYFKARLCFPDDYPYSPPTMHFMSRMYHPNIYENGEVCISILHSPGDDPQSGELPSERWNPTQNVRTILLSVISLLNEPNVHSAAHVDASVAYRKWKESNGVQDEYERVVTSLVKATHEEAKRDGVTVPTTLEEYCVSGRSTSKTFYQCGDTDELSDYDDHNEYYGSDEDDYDNVSIDVEDEKINSTKESQLSAKIDSGVDDPCISKGVNSGESSRVVDHRISSDYSRVTSPS